MREKDDLRNRTEIDVNDQADNKYEEKKDSKLSDMIGFCESNSFLLKLPVKP